MKIKFIFLFICYSSVIFSQRMDTLLIKKEKGYQIYEIHIRNSDLYNDISNFSEFQKGAIKKIELIGLHSKWVRIHLYHGKYVLYAPCDWCNDYKFQINDGFLQFRGCELIKQKIISIQKIKENEFKIEFVSFIPNKHNTTLRIKQIDPKNQIYEFRYVDGLVLRKMLFIKDTDYKEFALLNNDCGYYKAEELSFED